MKDRKERKTNNTDGRWETKTGKRRERGLIMKIRPRNIKGGRVMGGKKRILVGLIGLLTMLAWSASAWAVDYGDFSISGW
ncbi:MAG TPA: hypothetical protein PK425_08625, partial [Syntrophales bacterium]|nr:hypothetical protein [Syntrophales bacterium]